MDKPFERKLLMLMLISALFLVFTADSQALSEISTGKLQNEYPGIMRFHVIANSDSPEDQTLKYIVRDKVLEYINSIENIIKSLRW